MRGMSAGGTAKHSTCPGTAVSLQQAVPSKYRTQLLVQPSKRPRASSGGQTLRGLSAGGTDNHSTSASNGGFTEAGSNFKRPNTIHPATIKETR